MPLMAFFTTSGEVLLLSKEERSDRGEITKQVTEQLRCMKKKFLWGYSSAGRALEWHSRGQEFDPP